MNEIICPSCGKPFKIDETGYASISQQVRDHEFNKQLKDRLDLEERKNQKTVELECAKIANKLEKNIDFKDKEIEKLKAQIQAEKEKHESAIVWAKNNFQNELQIVAIKKNSEIQELKTKIETNETNKKLEITEAIRSIEKQYNELKNNLEKIELEKELSEQNLKERYERQIRDRDDEIQFLRNMKSQLSTKMVGETLEQHCEIEFNSIRATGFPHAYFEKDNDSRAGSKGDYIFRDFDENKEELVSIMFEMKNETDSSDTKKRKNEEFFEKLNKDRNEKRCEYAILVSLLERENDLYNKGIVDVSHRFPKMYVIRPQFFIPIITLLRNSSLKSLEYKTELSLMKKQNIDITNFENKLENFKDAFTKNYELASRHFKKTIDEIDKSIKHLTNVKDFLLGTNTQLRYANDKVQDITIKKLTYNNPTMKNKFLSLNKLCD